MESPLEELFSEECERPQHLKVDKWWIDYASGPNVDLWDLSERHVHEFIRRKYIRRLEEWLDKAATYPAPSSEKLAEAKRQRFTTEGKSERVSRSLAVLSQPPRIRLTPEEWRKIVEDADLEDQSS